MTPGLVIQGEASLCPWQQLLRADGRSWLEVGRILRNNCCGFQFTWFPPCTPEVTISLLTSC